MLKKRGTATATTSSSSKFYIAICKEMCRDKQSMRYFSVLQNSLDEFCYAYIFMSKLQRPFKFQTYRIYYTFNLY